MKYINNRLRVKVITLCAAIVVVFNGSCKKPTDGLTINVSTSIIKYSALVNFVDAKDGKTIPQNIKLKISGNDGGSVYNIAGQKDFTVSNGEIDVGLHPGLIPTAGKPVTFNLEISADNCLPVTQQVMVYPKQFFQTMTIALVNLSSPPAGVNVVSQQVDASTGKLTTQAAVKIGVGAAGSNSFENKSENDVSRRNNDVYFDDAVTSVVLPAGTTFYYYTYEKTDTIVGTRSVFVRREYGTPITIASSKTNVPNPLFGIKATGVSISTGGGGGSVDLTYTPYTDYYASENIYKYNWVKNAYKGKVNVVCLYSPGPSKTNSLSIFPDGNFVANTITLLNKQVSPEDEILFNSAVKQKLDYVYFLGSVNGQNITISPDAETKWTTSYVLDPNFINLSTGKKILPGDSIESGIDYNNRKTLHTAVIKTASGQLRAESRTQNVGNYYNATYKLNYTYNFNTGSDVSVIPDPENLSGYYFINCGSAGGYIARYAPNSGVLVETGKICSATPISANATYYSRYFNQTLNNTISNGSSANVFTGWTSLKPLVAFDVSLICNLSGGKSNTIKPTYSNTVTSTANGPFVFKSVDGYWATRGLTPGQSISYSVYLSKGTITFTKNSVSEGLNPITITYTGSSNSFCKIL